MISNHSYLDDPLTVFAPSDDAFDKVPDAELDALLSDKQQLTGTNILITFNHTAANIHCLRFGLWCNILVCAIFKCTKWVNPPPPPRGHMLVHTPDFCLGSQYIDFGVLGNP